MCKKLLWVNVPVVLILLSIILAPGIAQAQGTWPPLEIQTSLQPQESDDLFRFDVTLNNVSDTDLLDLVITLSLPEGITFNRFETLDYATTDFDGKALSFTMLQFPAETTAGPMSAYVQLGGKDPNMLRTSIFAEWQGQMPGSVFLPESPMGEDVDVAAPVGPVAVETEVAVPTPEAEVEDTKVATPQSDEPSAAPAAGSGSLWELLNELKSHEFVDLTNTFGADIPRWPGFPSAEFKTIYDYDTDGFFAQEFVHVGQYGTHMDAPSHFHKGLRSLDEIGLKEMMAPLVVINVADKVASNPDYELTVDDVKVWETKYGPIPSDAFVAMRSDWSTRWPNGDAYFNEDAAGQAHYPGWTVDALKYLYEERGIVGVGHETLETDAALAQTKTGSAAKVYALGTNHYEIGLLTNLDKVPETGAIVFAVVPKPRNGSGFPARVFAVLP